MTEQPSADALSGEDLRAAVAVELFGFKRWERRDFPGRYFLATDEGVKAWVVGDAVPAADDAEPYVDGMKWTVPDYVSWTGMPLVLERLRELGWNTQLNYGSHNPIVHVQHLYEGRTLFCGGATLPEAAARAAVAAVRALAPVGPRERGESNSVGPKH